jgi:nitric oxide reductase subunit C
MTKRQTRLFFFVTTFLFSALFIVLTIDTHHSIRASTHEDQMDAAVLAGKDVWTEKNCTNCHTLLGEGAYYAPDLTKITQQRGDAYLREFFKDPSRFFSEERDRRLMPNQNLSDEQISHLIAFLSWVSRIDTQGWPPRPILVSGAAVPGANIGAPQPRAVSDDPVALGAALFATAPPGCSACHSTVAGVNLVGPSLAGIAARTEHTLASGDYHGTARDAAAYIRESIEKPSAYLVAGPNYAPAGQSLMPANFTQTLTPKQLDQLVAYLLTLR